MVGDQNQAVTRELAEFVSQIEINDIPNEVWECSKYAVTDWFANVVAGRGEPLASVLTGTLGVLTNQGPAVEFASGRRVNPQIAAMVNATLAHSKDFDDVHLPSGAHATAPALAAALAVANEQGVNNSRKIAAAHIVGYEAMVRIGAPLHETLFRTASHPTGTFGYFGSAAASTRMLGLNVDETVRALGIAGSQAGSCTQVRGTMNKPFLAGHSAQGGVVSGYLSAAGYESATDILEGDSGFYFAFGHRDDVGSIVDGLGSRWAMLQNSIKVHASCAMSHALIDGVLVLRDEVGAGAEVESIEIQMYPLGTEYLNRPQVTKGAAGKFSAQYCAAVAWLMGDAGPKQFTDERAAELTVREYMEKVKLVPLEGAPVDLAEVTVVLADGSTRSTRVNGFFGSPEKPLSWSQLRAKSDRLMTDVIGEERTRRALDILEGWPEIDLGALVMQVQP